MKSTHATFNDDGSITIDAVAVEHLDDIFAQLVWSIDPDVEIQETEEGRWYKRGGTSLSWSAVFSSIIDIIAENGKENENIPV